MVKHVIFLLSIYILLLLDLSLIEYGCTKGLLIILMLHISHVLSIAVLVLMILVKRRGLQLISDYLIKHFDSYD